MTTTSCQGCRFAPEGAWRATSNISMSSSFGSSSFLYLRMLLLFWIAVSTSIISTLLVSRMIYVTAALIFFSCPLIRLTKRYNPSGVTISDERPIEPLQCHRQGAGAPTLPAGQGDPELVTSSTSEEKLWRLHRDVNGKTASPTEIEKVIGPEGQEPARSETRALRENAEHCRSCEKRCGADRSSKGTGKCGIGPEPHIASHFLHRGEEKPLNPSYTVFFAGCNFECAFCQNHDISTDAECGRYIPPEVLARRIEVLTEIGQAGFHVTLVHDWPVMAKNVNWVGGDRLWLCITSSRC